MSRGRLAASRTCSRRRVKAKAASSSAVSRPTATVAPTTGLGMTLKIVTGTVSSFFTATGCAGFSGTGATISFGGGGGTAASLGAGSGVTAAFGTTVTGAG